MAFKKTAPETMPAYEQLTARRVGIGFNFAAEPEVDSSRKTAASRASKAFYEGAPVELRMTGTEFQIKRRGEDERFVGSKLRVPAGVLRDRAADVLAPDVLVKSHAGYRNCVLMGPSFRADVWTVLAKSPSLSVADVARRAACSFATAWQAMQDFKLLHSAEA